MLAKSEAEYFDEFYDWRTSGKYIRTESRIKNLSFLILFGFFRSDTDTWDICNKSHCVERRPDHYNSCSWYEPGRCDVCIRNKYKDSPSTMKAALAQKENDLNEYYFYKHIYEVIKIHANQLATVVGPYRIELFYEEMQRRGRQSVDKYVKKNPRESKDKFFEVAEGDMKYYERKYIEENDFWSIFKETQIEGELLCSLLSDF